jgi:hypothetical protein
MSPEAQAIVAAAVGGGMASGEASGAGADPATAAAGGEDVKSLLQQILAKLGGGVDGKDAGSPAAGAEGKPTADKKDGGNGGRTPRRDAEAKHIAGLVNPEAVLAEVSKVAAESAAKSARATYDAAAKFVGVVRKDGHADVDTPDEAAAVMLRTVKAHLPRLLPVATEHLKAQRLDGLTALYQQAEDLRREGLLRTQMDAVADVYRADAAGVEADAAATGRAPLFTSPPPRGEHRSH